MFVRIRFARRFQLEWGLHTSRLLILPRTLTRTGPWFALDVENVFLTTMVLLHPLTHGKAEALTAVFFSTFQFRMLLVVCYFLCSHSLPYGGHFVAFSRSFPSLYTLQLFSTQADWVCSSSLFLTLHAVILDTRAGCNTFWLNHFLYGSWSPKDHLAIPGSHFAFRDIVIGIALPKESKRFKFGRM